MPNRAIIYECKKFEKHRKSLLAVLESTVLAEELLFITVYYYCFVLLIKALADRNEGNIERRS